MKSAREKGAALVEFALVLLPLLLLLVGTADVGMLLYNQQILTNASREGARAGIANRNVQAAVMDYCRAPNSGWKLFNFVAPNATAPRVIVAPSAVFQDDFVVTVEYDYTFLFPQLLGFDEQVTLTGQTTMKVELQPAPP